MRTSYVERFGPWIIAVAVASAPFCAWTAVQVLASNSNDMSNWLPLGDPTIKEFFWFQRQFELEEHLLVSWDGCTLADDRLQQFADLVRRRDESLPPNQRWFGEKVVSGREALQQLMIPPLELSKQESLSHLQGSLVGRDDTTGVIMTLKPAALRQPEAVMEFLIFTANKGIGISSEKLHVAGSAAQIAAANQETATLFRFHSSVAALIALFLAYLFLRSLVKLFILFSVALLSTGYGMAVLYLCDVTMNAMLIVLPALWFVLTLSGGMHLLDYYRHALEESSPQNPATRAVLQGWLPCTLATATTVIGLASLTTSSIMPIRQFGGYAAAGMLISLALLFSLLPALLHLWYGVVPTALQKKPQPTWKHKSRQFDRLSAPSMDAASGPWRGLHASLFRWRTAILAGSFLVLALGVCGGTRLEVSFRLNDYYSDQTRIFRDYTWLEKSIGPLETIEVVLNFDHSPDRLIERLQQLREIQEAIESRVPGTKTLSAAGFTPKMPEGAGVRQTIRRSLARRRIIQHRPVYIKAGYLAEQRGTEYWRITVRIPATSEADESTWLGKTRSVVDRTVSRAEQTGEGPREILYTGAAVLVSDIRNKIWSALLKSFLLAFAMITLVMILVLRGVGAGLISMIPNLMPTIVTFGVMGWWCMPLGIGAILSASVAVGIAVDDSFHFLVWFSRARKVGISRQGAVLYAYCRAGNAMVKTSFVLGIALLAFVSSDFVPASRFGVLMSTMLFTALVGDLVVLPAILFSRLGRLVPLPRGANQRMAASGTGIPGT